MEPLESPGIVARKPLKQAKLPVSLTSMLPGQHVRVRLDDGSEVDTVTTSLCWKLGHGAWVVKTAITGAGGFDLARITRIDNPV